jgi:glycosyltransferase involved in cell wall biosynthesis
MSDEQLVGVISGLVGELSVVSARAVAGERALDGVLGEGSQKLSVDLGRALETVAQRVVDAENRAVVAEFRYQRLYGRRATRVGVAVGGSLRPREWGRLPGRLRSGVMRHEVPSGPVLVDVKQVMGELAPVGDVLHRGLRLDYPYLRVAHWGPVRSFGSMAPHREIGSVGDVDDLIEDGADMLVVEPVAGVGVSAFVSESVDHVVGAGIPVVLFARTVEDLDWGVAGSCSVIMTDDVDVARVGRERFGDRVLAVVPFVDDTVFNPILWQRCPENMSGAVLVPPTAPVGNDRVLDGLIRSDAVVYRLGDKPVADATGFVKTAKMHPVALVDPTHFVSETTFLTQVVRMVACGTPVITMSSPHLDVVFPDDDLVTVVETVEEAREAYDLFTTDLVERERRSVRARQFVLQNHTTRHRFDALLAHLGIPVEREQKISILLVTKRPDFLEHAISQICSQTYPVKELVTVLHGDDFDLEAFAALTDTCDFPTVTVQQPPSVTFGDCLNTAIDHATGDLVSKMDDDDYYGPNHLTDLVTALHYSQADIVGRGAENIYLADLGITVFRDARTNERYRHRVAGPTITMSRDLATTLRFDRVNSQVDSTLFDRAIPQGCLIYSMHPFGFVLHRHDKGHTWDVSTDYFTANIIAAVRGVETRAVDHAVDRCGGLLLAKSAPPPDSIPDILGQSFVGVVSGLVGELASMSARLVAGERALDGVFGRGSKKRSVDSRRALEGVARRVVDAENRAVVAEFRFRLLYGRRASRVGVAFGDSARPRQWPKLPGRLRHGAMRHEVPAEPVLLDVNRVMGELAPVGDVLHRGLRLDYPYLRIGHWGAVRSFGSMAPYRDVVSVGDVDGLIEEGADMLVLEPVVGVPVPAFFGDGVSRVVDAGIPVVLFARTVEDLDSGVAGSCSMIFTDDADVARVGRERFGDRVMSVVPFVDDTVFNPISWQRSPDEMSGAVFTLPTRPVGNDPVLDGVIRSDATVYRLGDKPVADVDGFVSVAKSHAVAIVDPSHFVSEARFLTQVVRLVACGTPVITVSSPHLDVVFPDDDLVAAVGTVDEARETYDLFTTDLVERERRSVRARQFVLQNHTTRRRFDALLTHLGIPVRQEQKISILLVTKRPDFLEHAIAQIRSQVYPVKELVTVLHGDDFDLDEFAELTASCDFPTVTVQQPSSMTFGDCLNTAIDYATGDLISKMDDDDYYGPNHLTDLVIALHYSQADIVGKRTNFVIFEGLGVGGLWNGEWTEVFSRHIPGATMLTRAALLRQFRFRRLSGGVDSDLLWRTRNRGATHHASHPYNFVRVRHDDHTFMRSDAEFLQKTERLKRDFEPADVYL